MKFNKKGIFTAFGLFLLLLLSGFALGAHHVINWILGK